MVGRGWGHEELMRMPEPDFVFWRTEQAAYDEAIAKARAEARQKAARRRSD